jgi:hypothetical protein
MANMIDEDVEDDYENFKDFQHENQFYDFMESKSMMIEVSHNLFLSNQEKLTEKITFENSDDEEIYESKLCITKKHHRNEHSDLEKILIFNREMHKILNLIHHKIVPQIENERKETWILMFQNFNRKYHNLLGIMTFNLLLMLKSSQIDEIQSQGNSEKPNWENMVKQTFHYINETDFCDPILETRKNLLQEIIDCGNQNLKSIRKIKKILIS